MDILIADLVIIGCVIAFVIIGLRAMLNGAQSDAEKITEAKVRASHPWPLIHTSGCKQVAFRFQREPQPGGVAESALAVTYDGQPVEPYSEMRCPRCNGKILATDLSINAIKAAYEAEQARP